MGEENIKMPMHGEGYVETGVAARLDRLPWSKWHWLIVTALGITWVLDGLEATLGSALAGTLKNPEISLGLSDAEIGLGATIYLIGQVAGTLVFGFAYLCVIRNSARGYWLPFLHRVAHRTDTDHRVVCHFLCGFGGGRFCLPHGKRNLSTGGPGTGNCRFLRGRHAGRFFRPLYFRSHHRHWLPSGGFLRLLFRRRADGFGRHCCGVPWCQGRTTIPGIDRNAAFRPPAGGSCLGLIAR